MTTQQAAKDIYLQTGAPWAECMRWAAACKREADAMAEGQRLAYHQARREQLRGLRFRARLAAAPLVIEGSRGIEGTPGFAVIYCPPRESAAV